MPKPNRDRIVLTIQQQLACVPDDALLPMPHTSKSKKVSLAEKEEYRLRVARYNLAKPEYEGQFGRPTRATAEAVWKVLTPCPVEEIAKLSEEERRAFVVLLDVCVNAGLENRNISYNTVFDALGRKYSDHYRKSPASIVRDMREETAARCRRDLLLNSVDVNRLWRLLVGQWSSERGGNPLFWIRRHTFTGKGQHLVVAIRQSSGTLLDQFQRILNQDERYLRTNPQRLTALIVDGVPFNKSSNHATSSSEWWHNEVKEICAEVPYNEVKLGDLSRKLLEYQSQARLLLNTGAFKEDYEHAETRERQLSERLKTCYGIDPLLSSTERWNEEQERKIWSPRESAVHFRSIAEGLDRQPDEQEQQFVRERALQKLAYDRKKWEKRREDYIEWRNKNGGGKDQCPSPPSVQRLVEAAVATRGWRETVRAQLAEYDRAHRHVLEYKHVNEQLREKAGYQLISSGFYRIINRRYQPVHFWPTGVTSKNRQRWFEGLHPKTGEPCELVGFDISSSQTQIVATLLGVEALEGLSMASAARPFKVTMAEWAWARHQDPHDDFKLREIRAVKKTSGNYTGPEDKRLQELCKHLWMRVSYGSTPYSVAEDQKADPGTYGPGWTAENANRFLLGLYLKFPEIKQFLDACRRIAEVACDRDPCSGVTLTDPSDGSVVRWNPVARADRKLSNSGCKLILSLPGTTEHGRFIPAGPDRNKEYPVNRRALRKIIAPCLVHMLDAYYSSLVMEKLVGCGVLNFVGIHDCWLVSTQVRANGTIQEGTNVLAGVMKQAAAEWYVGLGSVYEDLLRYLSGNQEFEDFIREAQSEWQRRVKAGNRPVFLANRS